MKFKPSDIIQPFIRAIRSIAALFGTFKYGSGVKYGQTSSGGVGTFTPSDKVIPYEQK